MDKTHDIMQAHVIRQMLNTKAEMLKRYKEKPNVIEDIADDIIRLASKIEY